MRTCSVAFHTLIAIFSLSLSRADTYNCSTLSIASWEARDSSGLPVTFQTGLIPNPEYLRLDADETVSTVSAAIPDEFDARLTWKHCPSISKIVDQGCCGSCWAYSSASVMTDRQCIHAREDFEYSVEDITSCGHNKSWSSCRGGDPADAFKYWISHGVVSGGGFNSSQGCLPYEVPPSGKHCLNVTLKMTCTGECEPPSNLTYESDLHHGDRLVIIHPNNTKAIQTEIMHGGPVVVGMDVYQDFRCYREGIYEYVNGSLVAQHAVRLIGWGTQDGQPYWLAANSWGTDWGNNGFFKIKRGVNECNIEAIRVCAAYPLLRYQRGDKKRKKLR